MTTGASWFAARGAALLWVALAAAGGGGKPALHDLQVSSDGQQVGVSVRLANAFDDAMLERLESGLPTELTYRFRLYRDRKNWWNGSIERASYQIIAMYNAVSREYLVNFKLDGKLTETRVVRDLEALERAMTEIDQVRVFVPGTMPEGAQLVLRARVELGSGTWLFIFPTTRTTDWIRSRKFRPSELD
jgi:hypothetical protein